MIAMYRFYFCLIMISVIFLIPNIYAQSEPVTSPESESEKAPEIERAPGAEKAPQAEKTTDA